MILGYIDILIYRYSGEWKYSIIVQEEYTDGVQEPDLGTTCCKWEPVLTLTPIRVHKSVWEEKSTHIYVANISVTYTIWYCIAWKHIKHTEHEREKCLNKICNFKCSSSSLFYIVLIGSCLISTAASFSCHFAFVSIILVLVAYSCVHTVLSCIQLIAFDLLSCLSARIIQIPCAILSLLQAHF